VVRSIFIALVPCLLAQIWVRRFTEPYPAILLPAGATLMRSHGEGYTVTELTLLVEDAHGLQHPCSPSALLDTVPSDYRRNVIRRGFGLIADRDVRFVRVPSPQGGFFLRFGHPLTQSQMEETRGWLRSKLRRNLGVDAVRIHILRYSIQTFGREQVEGQDKTLKEWDTVELVATQ
jgi:hypothetical protein